MTKTFHVAVIGGGCAGLAAAATLAQHGIAVTLFEASPQLGGRARSISWKGQVLDNGQHILLGAYKASLRLLRLAGIKEGDALLRRPLQLSMHNEFVLNACTWLPAPLHILAGLIKAKGLSWRERLAAIRFMLWMRVSNFKLSQDEPLSQLLARRGQPQRLTSLLWEPLCLAALNTPLQSASAQVFLNVLRDSFAGAKADSDLLLPRFDLSTLMAEPLAAYIISRGGIIKKNSAVNSVAKEKKGYLVSTNVIDTSATASENTSALPEAGHTNMGEYVKTHNDKRYYSHLILAVSPFRLADISGNLSATMMEQVNMAENMHYQPIYTVYLQYPAEVALPQPMLGFASRPGRYCQWVFDRGSLYGQHGLLAVVISAQGEHQKLTQEALARHVEAELASEFATLYPIMPKPLWHKVIAEKRATFACEPNLARPQQITPVDGLYLAGDYTAGDYPATIEGAVRSGVQCANYIINSRHTDAPAFKIAQTSA